LQWFKAHSRVEENKYFVQSGQNRACFKEVKRVSILDAEVKKFEETGESEILSEVVLKNGVFVTDSDEAAPICDELNTQTT